MITHDNPAVLTSVSKWAGGNAPPLGSLVTTLVDEMRPDSVLVGVQVTADGLVDVKVALLAGDARLLPDLDELMHSKSTSQRYVGQLELVSNEAADPCWSVNVEVGLRGCQLVTRAIPTCLLV